MSDAYFQEIIGLKLNIEEWNKGSAELIRKWTGTLDGIVNQANIYSKMVLKPFIRENDNWIKNTQDAVKKIDKMHADAFRDLERAQERSGDKIKQINVDVANVQKQQVQQEVNFVEAQLMRELRERERVSAETIRIAEREVRARERAEREVTRAIQQEAKLRERAHAQEQGAGGRNLGRGLRAGAGIAGMLGMYRTAGAMYGLSNLSQMEGSIGNFVRAAGPALAYGSVVAGVAVATYKLVASGNELARNLSDLSTLYDGVGQSAEQMNTTLNKVTADAAVISVKYNKDINDLIKGMKVALSTGVRPEELSAFSDQAAMVSNALNVSFEDSIRIMTSLRDAYGLTTKDMALQSDRLFNLINVGKVEVSQLGTSFTKTLAPMAEAGISIESLYGAYATLTRVMTANQAGTALTSIRNHIINPSKEAAEWLEKIGVHFGDAAFRGRTAGHEIEEVLDEIIAKTHGNAEILGEIFPEAQARKGIAALIQMRALLTENTQAMYQHGTAMEANARQLANLPTTFDVLGKAISNVTQAVGVDLQHAIEEIFFGDMSAQEGALRFMIALEEVGKVIKGVIIGLITVGREAYNAFKVVYSTATFNPLHPLDSAREILAELKSFNSIYNEGDAAFEKSMNASDLRLAKYRGQLIHLMRDKDKPPTAAGGDDTVTGLNPTAGANNTDWFGDQDRLIQSQKLLTQGVDDFHRAVEGAYEPVKLFGKEYNNLGHTIDELIKHGDMLEASKLVTVLEKAHAANIEMFKSIQEKLKPNEAEQMKKQLDEEEKQIDSFGKKMYEKRLQDDKQDVSRRKAEHKKIQDLEDSAQKTLITRIQQMEQRKLDIIKKNQDFRKHLAEKLQDDLSKIEERKFRNDLKSRGNDPDFERRMLQARAGAQLDQLQAASQAGNVEDFDRIKDQLNSVLDDLQNIAGPGARVNGEKLNTIEEQIAQMTAAIEGSGGSAIGVRDKEDDAKIRANSQKAGVAIASAVQDAIKKAGAGAITNSGNITNNVDTKVEAKIIGIDPIELKRRVAIAVADALKKQVRERVDQTDDSQGAAYPAGADATRDDQ